MAYATQTAVSNGSMVALNVTIEYLYRSEISVYFGSTLQASGWRWADLNAATILFDTAVPVGTVVKLKRRTNISKAFHVYSNGAMFDRASMDDNFRQMLHVAQEIQEGGSTGVPTCLLARTGALTLANNAGTTIPWDSETYDPMGMHAPGASAVTAPVAGIYRINASYQISATSDANGVIITGIYLLKNGVAAKATPYSRHSGPNSGVFTVGSQATFMVQLAANDTIEIQGYYSGASATASIDTSFAFTYFETELVTEI